MTKGSAESDLTEWASLTHHFDFAKISMVSGEMVPGPSCFEERKR
jgi:hypothetical protein